MSGDLARGPDGALRCRWCLGDEQYLAYHDEEWGRPVVDERRIFEKLCLEGFQAGLSWLTILRKRESFRRAFSGFDPVAVAAFSEADLDRLLADATIVRHRGKIEAAVANGRATVELWSTGASLAGLLWSAEPAGRRRPPRTFSDLPAATAESAALSARLRSLGFRFVGPTTCYAAMQSLGVVDDHLDGCVSRPRCEDERAALGDRPVPA